MKTINDRMPVTYEFTDREAHLMRQAYHSTGHIISGDLNTSAVQRMVDAGLMSMEPLKQGRFLIRPTAQGREAWINQGLRAAGRPLTRLNW